METRMQINEQRVADVTILRLSGRLELDAGDVILREHVDRLVAEGRVNLIFDMKAVSRMDSAGIGMLVGKYMSAKNRGGTIRLLHLTDKTERLMHVTRLETVFDIYDREDAALQAFGVKP